jgi:hypothetical protein
VPAALVAAPWYMKNVLWLGSPLWPLTGGDPNDYNLYISPKVRFSGGLLGEPLIPFRLYAEGSIEYAGVRPPFALLLSPLYLIVPRHRIVTALFGLAAFHFVVWAQGAHVLRYLVQALPEVSVAAAYVLAELWRSSRLGGLGRMLASSALVGGLAVPVALTAVVVLGAQPFAQLVGLESRQAYLDRVLHNNPLVTHLNASTEAIQGVLMVGDDRGFYLRRPAIIDVSMVQFQRLVFARDADEARAHLREMGVSHVLVNQRDIDWYINWDPENRLGGWMERFNALRDGYLTVEATNEDSTLYRVIDGTGMQAAADAGVRP